MEFVLDEDTLGRTALALVKRLQPSLHANHVRVRDGIAAFRPDLARLDMLKSTSHGAWSVAA